MEHTTNMYKVWHKRVYFKYPNIGGERHIYGYEDHIDCCRRMNNSLKHSIRSSLTNTWIFEVNSFVPYTVLGIADAYSKNKSRHKLNHPNQRRSNFSFTNLCK